MHYLKNKIEVLKYIKILVRTTLSFLNFGCDLSLLSLCKLVPLDGPRSEGKRVNKCSASLGTGSKTVGKPFQVTIS